VLVPSPSPGCANRSCARAKASEKRASAVCLAALPPLHRLRRFVPLCPSFHRIPAWQGLAGPSVGHPAQPPAQAGSPRAGGTALRPGGLEYLQRRFLLIDERLGLSAGSGPRKPKRSRGRAGVCSRWAHGEDSPCEGCACPGARGAAASGSGKLQVPTAIINIVINLCEWFYSKFSCTEPSLGGVYHHFLPLPAL